METPNGKEMVAVTFTISCTAWMEKDYYDMQNKMISAEAIRSIAKAGALDMFHDNLPVMNGNWSKVFLELEKAETVTEIHNREKAKA
mgnify:CR=1 FL=1